MRKLPVLLIALAVLHVALINWAVLSAQKKPEKSPGAGKILQMFEKAGRKGA